MTRKNRKTLQTRFSDGAMPSMTDFADLIDSMLNIRDDGIERTPTDGLRLRQVKSEQTGLTNKLISFYKDIDMQTAIWTIQLNDQSGNLSFFDANLNNGLGDRLPLLSLSKESVDNQGLIARPASIGINQVNPEYELDVEGTISSSGRIGKKGKNFALANGKWQPILTNLSGCNAFEITAGAGKKNSGNYAIMHAFAMNAFNSKGEITYHQSHHRTKCNRIELRWVKSKTQSDQAIGEEYDLEIRVGCSYYEIKKNRGQEDGSGVDKGEGNDKDQVWIKYFITTLWFDREMKDCAIGPNKAEVHS